MTFHKLGQIQEKWQSEGFHPLELSPSITIASKEGSMKPYRLSSAPILSHCPHPSFPFSLLYLTFRSSVTSSGLLKPPRSAAFDFFPPLPLFHCFSILLSSWCKQFGKTVLTGGVAPGGVAPGDNFSKLTGRPSDHLLLPQQRTQERAEGWIVCVPETRQMSVQFL